MLRWDQLISLRPDLKIGRKMCILPLLRLFLHGQYNVKYHRSGQIVQADDRNDSGQLVDPRRNQISISQSFKKLLIFRQSLRKRKAIKHSKTDHNKLVQSWRLTQRIRTAASRLHACAIAPASFFLSLRQRNVFSTSQLELHFDKTTCWHVRCKI